jgi:hypothetical protein
MNHNGLNLTGNADLSIVKSGDSFTNCNLSQANPHTVMFAGLTGLTFSDCNLQNCDVPADSVVQDCLTVQQEISPVVATDPATMTANMLYQQLMASPKITNNTELVSQLQATLAIVQQATGGSL